LRLTRKPFYATGSSSLLPHIVLLGAIEGGGDYRTVSPLGCAPALLLDDGTLLTEGAAVVQWIADQVPSK